MKLKSLFKLFQTYRYISSDSFEDKPLVFQNKNIIEKIAIYSSIESDWKEKAFAVNYTFSLL